MCNISPNNTICLQVKSLFIIFQSKNTTKILASYKNNPYSIIGVKSDNAQLNIYTVNDKLIKVVFY